MTATKDPSESYYTGTARSSGIHNLLNCYRTDGEGVHMPMGDISKVEG